MQAWMEMMFYTMIEHELNQFRAAANRSKTQDKKLCPYSDKGLYKGISIICENHCEIHPEIDCCEACINSGHCSIECNTAKTMAKIKSKTCRISG